MQYKSNDVTARAKMLVESADFHNSMALVKSGVPFDVAFGCEEHWRLAMLVKLAEFEGQDFDWHSLRFYKRDE